MELQLTGVEVHELREALEIVLSGIDKEIAGLADPEHRKELVKRKGALRSVKDKLPVGLIETA
ncbi:MAG TPA: hypothetical protein VK944_10745 [Candidatus Limnocylindria bacterium]|nr:hypothetical protein [Candidatus Limnocylindria bacterium]